jgi:hypothetical protein
MMGRFLKAVLRLGMVAAVLAILALGLSGVVRAEPVHYKELLPFVELKLGTWEAKGKPHGSSIKSGQMQMSEVKASFRNGNQTLEIVIVDGGPARFALMGLSQGFEMESTEKYVKTLEIQGFKGMETYRFKQKQGELNINVADRFLVSLKGKGVDNTEALKAAAQQMDLKKLATLAK